MSPAMDSGRISRGFQQAAPRLARRAARLVPAPRARAAGRVLSPDRRIPAPFAGSAPILAAFAPAPAAAALP